MNNYAFLFPGQGSQYVGMGKKWLGSHAAVRHTFDEASSVLGYDLAKLCLEGPADTLMQTEYAQPAILTVSKAAYDVFVEESGIVPVVMAGHSLGEFSALVCAGAIAFADAVQLVRQRGRFMQEAVGLGAGAMSAITGASEEAVQTVCRQISGQGKGGSVVISNYNSPDQLVISGHKAAVVQAGEELARIGATVITLKVSAPFHSPLMEPAAVRLRKELGTYTYFPLRCPVISNVTARVYSSHTDIAATLSAQMTHPVRWVESMRAAADYGITAAVELGPQAVLRNFMRRLAPEVQASAYDKEEDAEVLRLRVRSDMQGASSSRSAGSHEDLLSRCLTVAVSTKNRNDDHEEYETGVVMPYRKAMKLHDELQQVNAPVLDEHEKQGLLMLHTVFEAKRTPQPERAARYRQLLNETGQAPKWNDYVSELLQLEGWFRHG
ncbi:ACP S-malonyltransferase [Paenibacillus filicis]|uniref:[acyl-carrier-protein] S-malonyltransferase n=1 Tax=Paenibacillus filicis TaxID=669464 RepID=A0ABU9DEL2_9BACL